MTSLRSLVVALVALTAAVPLQAQTATIQAVADVQTPLTVSGTQNLDFGKVFPGVASTIAYTSASAAGRFAVSGQANAQVNVTFALPTALTSTAGAVLPISNWTGYYNPTNSAGAGGTVFTPAATASTTTLGADGALFLFLGATVTPSATQTAGAYGAPIDLTVVYTGL